MARPHNVRGNAGKGRAAGSRNKVGADVRSLAQQYTAEALATLAEIMRTGQAEQARVAAANALLDRGHGRAAQSIHATGAVTVHDERVRSIAVVIGELFGPDRLIERPVEALEDGLGHGYEGPASG